MKFKNLFVAVALLMVLNLFGGVFGAGQMAKAENATDPVYDENAIALSQDIIKRAEPSITINESDLTATVNSRMLTASVGAENARIVMSHIGEYNALTREQRANGEDFVALDRDTASVKSGFNLNGGCTISAKMEWHWWGAGIKMNHCLVQAITLSDFAAIGSFINWLGSKGFWGFILAPMIVTQTGIYVPFLKAVDAACGKGATLNASYFTLPFGWVTSNC